MASAADSAVSNSTMPHPCPPRPRTTPHIACAQPTSASWVQRRGCPLGRRPKTASLFASLAAATRAAAAAAAAAAPPVAATNLGALCLRYAALRPCSQPLWLRGACHALHRPTSPLAPCQAHGRPLAQPPSELPLWPPPMPGAPARGPARIPVRSPAAGSARSAATRAPGSPRQPGRSPAAAPALGPSGGRCGASQVPRTAAHLTTHSCTLPLQGHDGLLSFPCPAFPLLLRAAPFRTVSPQAYAVRAPALRPQSGPLLLTAHPRLIAARALPAQKAAGARPRSSAGPAPWSAPPAPARAGRPQTPLRGRTQAGHQPAARWCRASGDSVAPGSLPAACVLRARKGIQPASNKRANLDNGPNGGAPGPAALKWSFSVCRGGVTRSSEARGWYGCSKQRQDKYHAVPHTPSPCAHRPGCPEGEVADVDAARDPDQGTTTCRYDQPRSGGYTAHLVHTTGVPHCTAQ